MRPGGTLIAAGLVLLFIALGVFFLPHLTLFWYLLLAMIALLACVDGLLLRSLRVPQLERRLGTELSLGEKVEIVIFCRATHIPLPRWTRIYDQIPDSFRHQSPVLVLKPADFTSDGVHLMKYHITAVNRGDWSFDGFRIQFPSPLGFWMKFKNITYPSAGRTLPNFKALSRLAAREITGKTDRTGVKVLRKRGQGMEFDSLRDYVVGDSVRFIDWKATSKRRKPVVKTFKEEQDQQVIFVLDTGYRLHQQDGRHFHFDKALDSLLLLAYISLRHSDSVGVLTFGNQERWIPPVKGLSRIPTLINALYDVESANVSSSPAAALERVLSLIKRRSLIILMTNLKVEDRPFLDNLLPRIPRRHLLLAVNLKEESVHLLSRRSPENYEDALIYAAADRYLYEQRLMRLDWERKGVMVMETRPSTLGPDLINRYLELKGQGKI